ncbi:hypothetical protein LCGC14_0619560 [marine sediment metagenome]|uniref:Uncharacterized protein n=1 Tax=marine sediment metagenome TaxID=412755 RepID=A0A0F9RAA9_9ZZZZ|nr:hypothetical protein [Actinomycetota bacterium]
MKECEEHEFGKWKIADVHEGYLRETNSCMTCGASRVRLVEIVEPINTRPDYAVVNRRDLEQLERVSGKKIGRVE